MDIDAGLLQRVKDDYDCETQTGAVEMALREMDRRKHFKEFAGVVVRGARDDFGDAGAGRPGSEDGADLHRVVRVDSIFPAALGNLEMAAEGWDASQERQIIAPADNFAVPASAATG